MKQIPTANKFIQNRIDDGTPVPDLLIEFAKLHVKAALEAAKNNAVLKLSKFTNDDWYIDGNSILNSYPDSNIK